LTQEENFRDFPTSSKRMKEASCKAKYALLKYICYYKVTYKQTVGLSSFHDAAFAVKKSMTTKVGYMYE